MSFPFWVSLAIFLLTVSVAIEFTLGMRKVGVLRDTAPLSDGTLPRVSIIAAALNEAETIEPALRSLLALDYPNLEIIAINDRSTDATPQILERLAGEFSNLRVLHVHELPPGWLGKVNAMHQGAQLASGDYLLFTDADVIFEPSTIRRAIAYCERHAVDHLTLIFESITRSDLLRMMTLAMKICCFALVKPWKVATSPRHFIGVGAFNLVRATTYREIGGHAKLPLAVIDDVMLGQVIKQSGFNQHVLDGAGLVAVEWYRTPRDMYWGLMKSSFASLGYRVGALLFVTLLIFTLRAWPWLGFLTGDLPTRLLCAGILVAETAIYLDVIRPTGWSRRCLFYFPVTTTLQLILMWHSALRALWRGGVEWRGTFYSLEELRSGLPRNRAARSADAGG